MTRKRFVKQLMAHGISRDQAVGSARQKPADKSYTEYYPLALMAGMLGLVAFSASNVSSALRTLATELAASIVSMNSICESVRESGEQRIEEEWRPMYTDDQKIVDFIRGQICMMYELDESEIEATVGEKGVIYVDIHPNKRMESVTICGTISYDLEDKNGN